MTLPGHPSQSIELWQLGLPPDGESSVQTVIIHGKPESLWDQTARTGASATLSQLQLAALKLGGALWALTLLPQTTVSLTWETACPRERRQPRQWTSARP